MKKIRSAGTVPVVFLVLLMSSPGFSAPLPPRELKVGVAASAVVRADREWQEKFKRIGRAHV